MLLTLVFTAASGLDALRLQPNERILIIAPHPDDEVLACGGLIQQALALGDSVWVVYVTAGDGSWPSAWRVTGNVFPGPEEYLELGRARIEEARAGAKLLGLDTSRLVFLGYPDDGITCLWQQHWQTPYRSSHTGAAAEPYARTGHQYAGHRLLDDLTSLLRTLRPSRLFAPHPLDAHPDHWSTAMFIAIAREAWRLPAGASFPELYCYLVHRPPYPGAQTDDSGFLSPPDDLISAGHHWFSLVLSDEQLHTKQKALGCHDSQQGTFGSDLYGYSANNELFDRIGEPAGVVTEDAPRVGFMPAAGLGTIMASVKGESLDLQVALPAKPSSDLDYSFFAHSIELDADSVIHNGLTVELTPDASTDSQGWSVRVPWRPSGRGVLLYSVEVTWGTVILNHSDIGRVVY